MSCATWAWQEPLLWYGREAGMWRKNVWEKGMNTFLRACFCHAGFHGLLTAIAWRSYEQHWEARTLVLKEASPSVGHSLPPSHLVSPWPHRFYILSCPATQPAEIEQHLWLHKRFLICLIWVVLRHRRSSNHESFHWEPSSAVGVV